MENIRDKKICAIIVTYNRKEWLSRCIQAVQRQSYKLHSIYIIDNASSDSTAEYLVNKNVISNTKVEEETLTDVTKDNIRIKYYRLSSNQGGAGGFFWGLKLAHELEDFDAYWLMDDDGYPSEDCLIKQMQYLDEYKYVMPISIDINNHKQLSWATRKQNGKKTIIYEELLNDWGNVMPFVFPFNGSLMDKVVIEKVGYVNPKLFIWGDDYEHYYRCLNANFKPVTILDAIFYHPFNKAPVIPIFFKKIQVPYVESKLRFVCLIRNWAFINKKNRRYGTIIKNLMAYSWLFLITRRCDFKGYCLFLNCTIDGFREKFDRHLKYIN